MATRRAPRLAQADSAFEQASRIAGLVAQPGLGAVKAEYRAGVALRSSHRHTASLDLDAEFLATEPSSPRWDYGIGIRSEAGRELLVWLAMTGAIRILPNSREARRLAQAGLSSPQRHVELP